MTKKLDAIRHELRETAERESMKVFRMARRAEAHGCSQKLVSQIRNEGFDLEINYKTYPERLLDWTAKDKLKYAFCGERMKHTYLTIGCESGDVIKMEVR